MYVTLYAKEKQYLRKNNGKRRNVYDDILRRNQRP